MNSWYDKSIQQEAGLKDNLIMTLLSGLLATMPFAAACKSVAQQTKTHEQAVRQIALKANPKLQTAPQQPKPVVQPPQPTGGNGGMNMSALKAQLIQDEGNRTHVYKDSKGIKTIGIGCNLERKDMPQRLAALGVNYSSIISGKADLTPQQVEVLFNEDLRRAIISARSLVPNFDALPGKAQEVVANMVFNMGSKKLAGFKQFLAALTRHDYAEAARQMVNSDWYHQVGGRAKRLVAVMNSLAN